MKNFFKSEWAKLKAMNFTEKRQYLWEYYKLHLGITVLILVVIYGLLDAWVLNPPKDAALHVAWLANYEDDETLAKLASFLSEGLVTDAEKEEVLVTSFSTTGNMEYDMAKSQQFSALLSVGDLDAFIFSGLDTVTEAMPTDTMATADETLAALKEEDPALYGQIAPTLTETVAVREDGSEMKGVYAIPLSGAPGIERFEFNSDDLYMCVPITAEEYQGIVKAIRMFYEMVR